MNLLVSKQILSLHFAGQATPLQQKAIEDWLVEPDSLELYFSCLEEWERFQLQYEPNEKEAWETIWQQVELHPEKFPNDTELVEDLPVPNDGRTIWSRWIIAASIILLLLGSLAYQNRATVLHRTIYTNYGEVSRYRLPDGSTVVLNANSSLRYPRFGFGESTRQVFLTGEAVFSVRHLPKHQPFVVRTERGFDITVLGTEFSVLARARASKVVLNHGKIQIDYGLPIQSKKLLLMPGDVVAFDQKGMPKKSFTQHPELHASWQQRRFVFNETSLLEIATLIKDNYGLSVTIREEALSRRTISGTYKAKSVDQLLETVTQLLEINYSRQDNTVILFE